jgi:hypothetical protein
MPNQLQILVQAICPQLRSKTWASRQHTQAAITLGHSDAPAMLPSQGQNPLEVKLHSPSGLLKLWWTLRNFGK